MAKIVLTADRAIFTGYNDMSFFGFGLCLPCRLIPKFVEYKILAPPVPYDSEGRANFAPYSLSKVEAILLRNGFSREEVVISPPEGLHKSIGEDTKVVGVSVLDPLGLAPVPWTLKSLFGGGMTCTELEFRSLMERIREMKEDYGFKILVGGPGAWQLRHKIEEFGIDVLYEGEGEITLPKIIKELLVGNPVPKHVVGDLVKDPSPIPKIVTPSRNGVVQVMRGCPRRCRFCSPSMFVIKYMSMEHILSEAKLNLEAGAKHIDLISEDILLYGAKGIEVNHEKVTKLFSEVMKLCKKYWEGDHIPRPVFSHSTASTVLSAKNTVKGISEIGEYSEDRPVFPQVGFESGSPETVRKYFTGKPKPFSAEDWPRILVDGAIVMNEAYWYPCYTYIIGFESEGPKDYQMTIKVIEEIHDSHLYAWTFPLLLVPMGGSLLDGKIPFTDVKTLPEEAIQAMIVGWRHSVWCSKSLYQKLFAQNRDLGNKAKLLLKFGKYAINAMEKSIEKIEQDPTIILGKFSKVNIRSIRGLVRALLGGWRGTGSESSSKALS